MSGWKSASVIEYRAYFVGADGHFAGYEPLLCADDGEAIEKATKLIAGRDIELWSGPRLVTRLRCEKTSGSI
jgi:hypothetical protein